MSDTFEFATETEATAGPHVRVFNNSGAAYDNASIRLIVGNVNLVERVRQLAERYMSSPDNRWRQEGRELLRKEAQRKALDVIDRELDAITADAHCRDFESRFFGGDDGRKAIEEAGIQTVGMRPLRTLLRA